MQRDVAWTAVGGSDVGTAQNEHITSCSEETYIPCGCIKYRHLFVTHCDEKRNIFIQLNRENTSNLGKVSSWFHPGEFSLV